MREELEYPVLCHYRIIAQNIPKIDSAIEICLHNLGISNTLKKEKESNTGKYFSFSVDIQVESKKMMHRIDAQLCAIEGVKVVL